ncbi:MAG: hypothetical protein ABWY52_04445 [Candidatus Limnocylindrales bacterium]
MPESISPPDSETTELLAGRDAHRRHAWPEAYELLDRADKAAPLSRPALEGSASQL